MKKLILPLIILAATPALAAINCATLPTCSSLGYTQTVAQCNAKGLSYLKCPFDTTAVFCEQKNISVAAGYILYSDGTFSSYSSVDSSKTPVGVVIRTTSGFIDVVGTKEYNKNWYAAYNDCLEYGDYNSGASGFSWFLPYDPWDFITTSSFTSINTALSKIGGTEVSKSKRYWSSKNADMNSPTPDKAWAYLGNGGSAYAKTDVFYARCITRILRTN